MSNDHAQDDYNAYDNLNANGLAPAIRRWMTSRYVYYICWKGMKSCECASVFQLFWLCSHLNHRPIVSG